MRTTPSQLLKEILERYKKTKHTWWGARIFSRNSTVIKSLEAGEHLSDEHILSQKIDVTSLLQNEGSPHADRALSLTITRDKFGPSKFIESEYRGELDKLAKAPPDPWWWPTWLLGTKHPKETTFGELILITAGLNAETVTQLRNKGILSGSLGPRCVDALMNGYTFYQMVFPRSVSEMAQAVLTAYGTEEHMGLGTTYPRKKSSELGFSRGSTVLEELKIINSDPNILPNIKAIVADGMLAYPGKATGIREAVQQMQTAGLLRHRYAGPVIASLCRSSTIPIIEDLKTYMTEEAGWLYNASPGDIQKALVDAPASYESIVVLELAKAWGLLDDDHSKSNVDRFIAQIGDDENLYFLFLYIDEIFRANTCSIEEKQSYFNSFIEAIGSHSTASREYQHISCALQSIIRSMKYAPGIATLENWQRTCKLCKEERMFTNRLSNHFHGDEKKSWLTAENYAFVLDLLEMGAWRKIDHIFEICEGKFRFRNNRALPDLGVGDEKKFTYPHDQDYQKLYAHYAAKFNHSIKDCMRKFDEIVGLSHEEAKKAVTYLDEVADPLDTLKTIQNVKPSSDDQSFTMGGGIPFGGVGFARVDSGEKHDSDTDSAVASPTCSTLRPSAESYAESSDSSSSGPEATKKAARPRTTRRR